MKIYLLILLNLLPALLSAQDQNYPVATPTDQQGVVISPYDSTRQLDVTGLAPGSLAQDPVAKKIFRIPGPGANSAPTIPAQPDGADTMIAPPPITPPKPTTTPALPPSVSPSPVTSPAPPPQVQAPAGVPNDLLTFIYSFNQNSTVNDPDALLPFFADRVEDYFGEKNVSKTAIRNDRASYLDRYPQREYVVDGQPVLLSQTGDIYEVVARIKYKVQGSEKTRIGTVSDYFKIRRANRRFEIVSLNESKISTTTLESPPSPNLATRPGIPAPANSAYNRFEQEQIDLFLNAFTASGEINDPSAMIDFLHPQITTYYAMRNPNREELLKDRRDYIQRWPGRRYWLAEAPVITPNAGGGWDVVTKTGYEVKNNGKVASSQATSSLRIVQTNAGLKILSVTTL